jgi:hypothetical protein
MTTLLGIGTTTTPGGVVLASDRQFDIEKGKDGPNRTKFGRNLFTADLGKGVRWSMASCGMMSQDVVTLYEKLSGLKEGAPNKKRAAKSRGWLERAVKEDYFSKVVDLNREHADSINGGLEQDDQAEFLLALTVPKQPGVCLFEVDWQGNLKQGDWGDREFPYLAMGSGRRDVLSYMEQQLHAEKVDPTNIDLPTAISLVRGAYERSDFDDGTGGGYDFAVVTPKGVDFYGPEIRAAERKAGDKVHGKIARSYLQGKSGKKPLAKIVKKIARVKFPIE